MPWAKHHRKQKMAELDNRRRPKRRSYFKDYYHKKIKNDLPAYSKMKIRALTRYKYGEAKVCDICGSKFRVCHHHYTEPYEVDKFICLCEYHHMVLDYYKRYINNKTKKKEVINYGRTKERINYKRVDRTGSSATKGTNSSEETKGMENALER